MFQLSVKFGSSQSLQQSVNVSAPQVKCLKRFWFLLSLIREIICTPTRAYHYHGHVIIRDLISFPSGASKFRTKSICHSTSLLYEQTKCLTLSPSKWHQLSKLHP